MVFVFLMDCTANFFFFLTLGIGNIEPNMATDKPAAAPRATIARHFLSKAKKCNARKI